MDEPRRAWQHRAVERLEADFHRSADTHLLHLPLRHLGDIDLYLKDESTHPTGSLKHRLARSLFLYAICNNWLGPETPVIESSSGSTAVSEAYFAKLLGLRFIAVMPRSTAPAKIEAIGFYGGECHFVGSAAECSPAARLLAAELGGHFMDQFTYAERATDWRGNNNIAESLFEQMEHETHREPAWVVCGAGTGGTSATIGRYLRYNCFDTRLCLADPVPSVFHRHLADRGVGAVECKPSLIEGIGRPLVEPSFIPEIIDRHIAVTDAQSIAGARLISELLDRPCGGSTGTNLWAVMILAREMVAAGGAGSIVTILCDSGERYRDTYFSDEWVREHGFDLARPMAELRGVFSAPA